jgi:hypothetical protein
MRGMAMQAATAAIALAFFVSTAAARDCLD